MLKCARSEKYGILIPSCIVILIEQRNLSLSWYGMACFELYLLSFLLSCIEFEVLDYILEFCRASLYVSLCYGWKCSMTRLYMRLCYGQRDFVIDLHTVLES